jgi:hypothetical protein
MVFGMCGASKGAENMAKHDKRMSTASVTLLLLCLSAPSLVVGDYIEEFECEGVATHRFNTFKYRSEGFDGLPDDLAYKETEHYCLLPNGKKQGGTKITRMFYWPKDRLSTYAWGQDHNNKRVGRWVITEARGGEEIAECFYSKGKIKKGDPLALCKELLGTIK